MAKFFSHWSYTECVWSMVLQGLDGSLPRMVFPRVLFLVRYCILSIHLGSPHFWQKLEPKASFTRMIYKHTSTADPQMLLWSLGKWVMYWENWRHGCHPIACA